MTAPIPKTIVIGVGNPFRGDDGAGPAVARLLRPQLSAQVSVLEESGEGTALMDAWRGACRVILVDAVHSGQAPGTIHRIDASSAPLPAALFPCSTHSFGVADAIEMARALRELPSYVAIYGIEASSFHEPQRLSEEIRHAVVTVSEEILKELRDS